MSLSNTGHGPERLLPDAVEATLKRAIFRLTGVLLIIAACVGWLCLLTWSIHDPSLNHATNDVPNNIFGVYGAALADLLFQFLGLSAIGIFVPPSVWGWHMAGGYRPTDRRIRVLRWPIGIVCIAVSLAFLPVTETWPLPNGLGGVCGDYLHNALYAKFEVHLSWMWTSSLASVLFLLGLHCLLTASALGWRDLYSACRIDSDDLGRYLSRGFEAIGKICSFFKSVVGALYYRQRYHWKHLGSLNENIAPGHGQISELENELRSISRRQGEVGEFPSYLYKDGRREPFFGSARSVSGSQHPLPVEPPDLPPPVYTIDQGFDGDAAPKRWFRGRNRSQTPPQESRRAVPPRFSLPHSRLLARPPHMRPSSDFGQEALRENARFLEDVLQDFGIRGEVINAYPGPVVTLYELEPARGTKSARVIGLADDIARSMSAVSARVAVIPGRNAIGIELPNSERETVYLRSLIESSEYLNSKSKLPLALGKSIGGEPVIADLSRMPHLLIAGTTGSGKSVGINTMILSLLYRMRPDQCKFIMIDPKMLELSVYDGIPHLLTPVVTEPRKAVAALKWTVREMEERYKKMAKLGVRNIDGYNERVAQAQSNGEFLARTVQTGFNEKTGQAIYERQEIESDLMPYIVVVVDEMADLMMVAGKDIENAVQRLAQMARAAGIHLITATQRPSVDVITGTIKANFPTRISFQVTSKVDSRTILGEQGGEQLLGAGDMLYMAGGGRIMRVHSPFVSDEEIEQIANYLRSQGVPAYLDDVTEDLDDANDSSAGLSTGDDLYDQAVAIILRDRKVSTSYIQRRLSIGYNRAATLIEKMEEDGIISSANHAGRREILVSQEAMAS